MPDESVTMELPEDAKVSDLVRAALNQLVTNGLDAFEFRIEGSGPTGLFVLRFVAKIEMVDTPPAEDMN